MKKKCSHCGELLDISSFPKNKNKKDGLQTYCRSCKKGFDRQYYLNNKDYYIDRNKKERKEIKEWYIEFKKSLSCEKCGENKWYLLQFHHIESEEKELGICQAVQRCWSKERILKEIEKCNVLCSNCHIELHFLEKSGNWNGFNNGPIAQSGRAEAS